MNKRRIRGAFKSIKYKDIAYFVRNSGAVESLYKENHSIVSGLPTVLNYVDLPSASLYTNKVFRVLNVGVRGSLWFSNGFRWVSMAKKIMLGLVITPITLAVGVSNYQSMFSYLFPTNGVDSLWRIGDRIRLTVDFVKNGAVGTSGRGYSFGASANSGLNPSYTSPVNGQADASVVVTDTTGNSGAANTRFEERHEFCRTGNAVIKKIGGFATNSLAGLGTANLDLSVADLATATPPITNIDLSPIYFNVCYATNASDSGSIKFLMLELLSYSGN